LNVRGANKTPSESRTRHGLNALKARVTVRGLQAIDMRTAAAQSLIAWRNELLAALGGPENVSPQKMAVVDAVTRTRLYIDHADAWLMSQESLVNRRKKSLVPVLKERMTLVDSMARLLSQLGLERQQRAIPTLREYIAERETKPRGPDEQEPPEIDRDKEPPEATA
jgi:hypothetical protein